MRSLAVLLVFLAGCATVKEDASLPVHVVWQNVDDVQATCEEISGRREVFRILGCSQWHEPVAQGAPRVCSIYAPAPCSERDLQRFATLGHELMHCTDGNWHDRWGRMTDAKVRQAKAGERSSAAAGASAAATAAASASQD